MLCHICGDPAIGQCRICHQFHCVRHGRLFCVHCREQDLPAEGPHAPSTAVKEVSSPVPAVSGPCAYCGQPAHRACPVCGRLFCQEHRGWREARVGRYNLRRQVCRGCNVTAGGAASWLFWLLALLALSAGGAAIYWLTTTRW